MNVIAFVRYALTPRLLLRSSLTALVVGATLFIFNQGARAWTGPYTMDFAVRLALTLLVPLCVSLASSLLTRWELRPGEQAFSAGRHVCIECAIRGRFSEEVVRVAVPLPPCPTCGRRGTWVWIPTREPGLPDAA